MSSQIACFTRCHEDCTTVRYPGSMPLNLYLLGVFLATWTWVYFNISFLYVCQDTVRDSKHCNWTGWRHVKFSHWRSGYCLIISAVQINKVGNVVLFRQRLSCMRCNMYQFPILNNDLHRPEIRDPLHYQTPGWLPTTKLTQSLFSNSCKYEKIVVKAAPLTQRGSRSST